MVGNLTRRKLLKAAGTAGGGLLAVSSPSILMRSAVAGSEPIRIAVIQDMSKVYALLGDLHIKGLKLAFDAVGNEIGGRKIEMVVEDTGGDPAVALSKAKKTIATFKPHFVTGPIASNEYAAMKDVVTNANTVWLLLTQGAGAEDTVLPICSPNVFSVSWNNWQLSAPFARWAYENVAKEFWLGYANYNWGQGAGETFKQFFEAAGGKILGAIAPPFGHLGLCAVSVESGGGQAARDLLLLRGRRCGQLRQAMGAVRTSQDHQAHRPGVHGRRGGVAGPGRGGGRDHLGAELGADAGQSGQPRVS
jgi:hypothetical protein